MNTVPIEDMSKTYLEHSMVIYNFVVKSEIKSKTVCAVYSVIVFNINGGKTMIK